MAVPGTASGGRLCGPLASIWARAHVWLPEELLAGAWGTAIFSDDLAADIREDWRDYIGEGLTPDAATQRILADHAGAAADQDEAGVVWLALAVSQWRTGRTVPEVLARAIEVIGSGSDLRRWERENPRQRPARALVLAKAREQLLSQPPRPRPIPRPLRSQTPYRPGDVLGYRHGSGREFVFWVSRNWSDRGGEYNGVEVLDVGGPAALSLPAMHKIPAMRPGTALRGAGGLAGLTLVSASQIPADRIRLLGHVPYPSGRQRFDAWGRPRATSARSWASWSRAAAKRLMSERPVPPPGAAA